MKLCITGANSSVGRSLLRTLAGLESNSVVAIVRSSAAMAHLPDASNITAVACPYTDAQGLAQAFQGGDSVVHLAGILFEGPGNSYQSANVDSTAAVVNAAREAGVRHLVFVSVLGASAQSANPFYRTKGEAEALVQSSGLQATVLRTPLLLGPDIAGGQALLREASASNTKLLGGGHHRVRPLDVDDLCAAVLAACRVPAPGAAVLELCGPEALPYHALVRRMAERLGREVNIGTLPVWLAKTFAGLNHAFKGHGLSPAIIDVITSSETVTDNADRRLGLSLSPLDHTLAKLAGKEARND